MILCMAFVTTKSSRDTRHPPETGQPAVEVTNLVKTYPAPSGGTIRAVDGISFSVRRGEVFGMLGPNGAGKTTTLEMVEGLKRPTSGSIQVLGLDVAEQPTAVRRRIGVQLQAASYFPHLRLREILELFGSFYPVSLRADDLLESVGLADKRDALVRELSGGQAQRFSIVAALVNDPDLVFLDEPTTGLDPQARRNLWEVIAHLNTRFAKTVVLTTHYMDEAHVLSDRIAIVDHGRVIALDTPDGLIGSLPHGSVVAFTTDWNVVAAELESLPGVASVSTDEGSRRFSLAASDLNAAIPQLYRWASEADIRLGDLRVSSPTLEDVFLSMTGRSFRD